MGVAQDQEGKRCPVCELRETLQPINDQNEDREGQELLQQVQMRPMSPVDPIRKPGKIRRAREIVNFLLRIHVDADDLGDPKRSGEHGQDENHNEFKG